MTPNEIVELVAIIAVTLALIIVLFVAIARGDMKKFIEEKMAEAEIKYESITDLNEKAKLKLTYVIEAVKEKYKIMTIILNVKKVIEHIIKLSKQINYKK